MRVYTYDCVHVYNSVFIYVCGICTCVGRYMGDTQENVYSITPGLRRGVRIL